MLGESGQPNQQSSLSQMAQNRYLSQRGTGSRAPSPFSGQAGRSEQPGTIQGSAPYPTGYEGGSGMPKGYGVGRGQQTGTRQPSVQSAPERGPSYGEVVSPMASQQNPAQLALQRRADQNYQARLGQMTSGNFRPVNLEQVQIRQAAMGGSPMYNPYSSILR